MTIWSSKRFCRARDQILGKQTLRGRCHQDLRRCFAKIRRSRSRECDSGLRAATVSIRARWVPANLFQQIYPRTTFHPVVDSSYPVCVPARQPSALTPTFSETCAFSDFFVGRLLRFRNRLNLRRGRITFGIRDLGDCKRYREIGNENSNIGKGTLWDWCREVWVE